ncbi:cytochrome P450 4c21-like [Thrips palmi]|uniref:Cytochrome P450 4c21-like n=1 Tax=Thrips palmi TaxID=161013 RepID=A0A6P8YJJ5_THRPL|nr:cytochrome P450 4c21-like [Thrips palmi]
MALVVVALLVAVLVLAVQRLLRAYTRFRKMELAIPGPPSLPVLGNALDFLNVTEENVWPILRRLWGHRYELSRFSMLGRLVVIVSDADHIEKLMKRRDLQDKSRVFYEFLEYFSRRGLVTLNGAEWRSHRRALQPAFHQDVLDRYMEVFTQEAAAFVGRLAPNQEQNVIDNLHNLTSRAFVRTTLVNELDEKTEEAIPMINYFLHEFGRSVNSRTFQPLLWPDTVFGMTQPGRVVRKLMTKVDAFSGRVIAQRRAEHVQRRVDGADDDEDFIKQRRTLIDILVDPKSKTSDGKLFEMSDGEIMDEVKIFLGAAVETTVAALGWTIKVLSVRPEVQERLHAEVVEQLGGKEDLTSADINKLKYTEQVIKETLRLLPSVPFTGRIIKEETEFAGHTLPADTTVVLNILGCHRDPKHWPDPTRFDPDRFSAEQCAKRHPYAFLPFSAGMRNCIGGRYAMMVMKTTLAALVSRYRVDPVADGHTEPVDFPYTFDVSSRMLGGVRVVFTPRASRAA